MQLRGSLLLEIIEQSSEVIASIVADQCHFDLIGRA